MRIACLQFTPQVGDVDINLCRADKILEQADPKNLDLLVLPELAFTGYNFKSLNHISPYLEPAGTGISSLWARNTALKYDCFVTVGYPEAVDITDKWPTDPEYYNSSIVFSPEGEVIVNYRKTFLYHIDEKWALEGPDGFFDGAIPGLGNVVMGICMDLKFQAPWHAWEFANHILYKDANLVIVSMAWIVGIVGDPNINPQDPDMETLAYWLSRLEPVIRSEREDEIIVIFASRTGVEGEAVYAGTSAILGIEAGEVKVYGILGRGENELLVVDTSEEPKAKLVTEPSSTPLDYKSQNWDPPAPRTPEPDHTEYPMSIDAILSASKPISPVETRFPHSFFSPERPKSRHLLNKLNSSAHPDDVREEPDWSKLTKPSRNSLNSNRSSLICSTPLPMEPPLVKSSVPSSDYQSTMSSVPVIKQPNLRKSRKSSGTATPQKTDANSDIISRNGIQESLVIPMATVNLNRNSDEIPSPVSASSMTTHAPWGKGREKEKEQDKNKEKEKEKEKEKDKDKSMEKENWKAPAPTRTKEKVDSYNDSPFIAALQQSTSPISKKKPTVAGDFEGLPPAPQGYHYSSELGSAIVADPNGKPSLSRHPTADPARMPSNRDPPPQDEHSNVFRARSTGW